MGYNWGMFKRALSLIPGSIPGNMTKAQALEWLTRYDATVCGHPQEVAAGYLGLGVKRFHNEVADEWLPQPNRHGNRLFWDKIALDPHLDQVPSNTVLLSANDPAAEQRSPA
jgi:hypothetical protein